MTESELEKLIKSKLKLTEFSLSDAILQFTNNIQPIKIMQAKPSTPRKYLTKAQLLKSKEATWVDRYAPTKSSEIIDNNDLICTLRGWLNPLSLPPTFL